MGLSIQKKSNAFKKASSPLPKYNGGGGFSGGNYNINMGQPSSGGGGMGGFGNGMGIASGIMGAVGNMIPQNQTLTSAPQSGKAILTSSGKDTVDKNANIDKGIGAATGALDMVGGVASVVPGIGTAIQAGTKVLSSALDFFGGLGKKKAETVTYAKNGGKLTKFGNGGATQDTLFVNNPNDPRLRAYQDSLTSYNNDILYDRGMRNLFLNNPTPTLNQYNTTQSELINRYPTNSRLSTHNPRTRIGALSDADYIIIDGEAYKKPTRPVEYRKEEPIQLPDKSKPQMEIVRPKEVGKAKHNFKWQKDPNFPGTEMSLDEEGVYRDKKGVFTGKRNDYKLDVVERFDDGGPLSKSNKKDLIEYNGADHEEGKIKGIPVGPNGEQLGSGFESEIPQNAVGLVEDGEIGIADEQGSRILSKNGMKIEHRGSKKAPADTAKLATNAIKQLKKLPSDPIRDKTVARYEAELDTIYNKQEELKDMKNLKPNLFQAKNGGKLSKLPKYTIGGLQKVYSPFINDFGTSPYTTYDENTNTRSEGVPESYTTLREQYEDSIFDNKFTPMRPLPLGDKGIINTQKITPNLNLGNINRIGATPGIKAFPTQTDMRTDAAQRVMDNNSLSTPAATITNKTGLTLGDKSQLAGIIPATAYNFAQALRPAEKFNPINLGDNGMQHIKDARFNTNELLMNRNTMANAIQQGSTSNASRMANLQGLFRGTNTQLGDLAVKERLTNMNQGNLRAQTAFNTSQFNAGAAERSRGLNIQAKQAKQGFGAAAAEGLGAGLTQFGLSKNQNLTNRIGYDVLKGISPNFTLTDYNNLMKSGMTDGEIIKYISTLKK